MPDEKLDRWMCEDEDFRRVVFGVAQRACSKGAGQAACIVIRELAGKFRRRDRETNDDSSNAPPERRKITSGMDSDLDAPWWEQLAAHATTSWDRLAF